MTAPPPQNPLHVHLADRDVPCPLCGYNLRNCQAAQCPECGFELRIAHGSLAPPAVGQAMFHAFATLLAVLVFVGGAAVAIVLAVGSPNSAGVLIAFVVLVATTLLTAFVSTWLNRWQWLQRMLATRTTFISMFVRAVIITFFILSVLIFILGVMYTLLFD